MDKMEKMDGEGVAGRITHTPGPWEMTEGRHWKYPSIRQWVLSSESRAAMALVELVDVVPAYINEDDWQDLAEIRGNVALIAAAPDMHDLLVRAGIELSRLHDVLDDEGKVGESNVNLIDDIKNKLLAIGQWDGKGWW